MRFAGPCYHNGNYGITLHRLWYWQCLQSRAYNAHNNVMNSYCKSTVTILPILGGNSDLGNLIVSSQKQLWRSPAANINTDPWVYPDFGIILWWGRVDSMEIKRKVPQHEISRNSVTIFPIIGRSCDLGNLVVSGHKQLWRSPAANITSEWLIKSCGQWSKGYLVASSRKIYMPGLRRNMVTLSM